MYVLVVEDDPIISKHMEKVLGEEGFKYHFTEYGEEAIDLAKIYKFDAIVLDLNLPDMNGMNVLKKLRIAKVHTPVVIASSESNHEIRLEGLKIGADDFLVKPYIKDELIARLRAVIRRTSGYDASTISIGNLILDIEGKKAFSIASGNQEEIALTGKEFGVLQLLVLKEGHTVTSEMFLNHLYGGIDEPTAKIVNVFVCKLRKKILAAVGESYIDTVWGMGYVLRDPAKRVL